MGFSVIDANGRLFGRLNIIDAAVFTVLILGVLGLIAVQSGWHKTSGQVVKGDTEIEYSFIMRNAKVVNPDLFQVGKSLSMTIRNQPRGNVTITKVERTSKMALINLPNGDVKVMPDPTEKLGYDFLITVKDHATVTDEGYVTEGVKVKVGMNIDVEGFDYRFPATIVDVHKADVQKPDVPASK